MRESYVNNDAIARRKERLKMAKQDAKLKAKIDHNKQKKANAKKVYSREELIELRVAKEVVNMRALPAFWGLVITLSGIGLMVFSYKNIQSVDAMVMVIGVCLLICGGFLALIRIPIYLYFLLTEEYRQNRKPANEYNKAIQAVPEDELKIIIEEAHKILQVPFHIRAASCVRLPDPPLMNSNTIDTVNMFEQERGEAKIITGF
jgi:hypothetical protein